MIPDATLASFVRFIQETEALKSTLRTAWSASGRQESTAEHSWRLALFASLFEADNPGLDWKKILVMCLIHDLGELYEGDISAAAHPDEDEKYREERRAAEKVFSLLPEDIASRYLAIWQEYNDNATPEAHLVKALDKAETIIQHNQGKNPDNFDYAFNLEYGKTLFDDRGTLSRLRKLIDAVTTSKTGK